jgi:thymidylate synthase ThyX
MEDFIMAVEIKVKNTVFPVPFSEEQLKDIAARVDALKLSKEEEERLNYLKNNESLTDLEKEELKSLKKRKKNYEYCQDNMALLRNQALLKGGYAAGICYMESTYDQVLAENPAQTIRRINFTLNNGHHSVYDHLQLSFELRNIPKILAMYLNNEHQYTTSEKSARYTKMEHLSAREKELYDKWYDILVRVITEKYKHIYEGNNKVKRYNDQGISKLAQENARYMTSVFTPTSMEYSVEWRKLNYIYSWLDDYENKVKEWKTEKDIKFISKLIPYLKEFKACLEEENNRLKQASNGQLVILEPRLQKNEKNRTFSLLVDLEKYRHIQEQFDYNYSFKYKGSFAQLAQAHRHRNLYYSMALLEELEFFVPEVIADNEELKNEWLRDILSVADLYPQGMLVSIHESGDLERLILKAKERLCTCAQLEINNRTNINMQRYYQALKESNPYLAKQLEPYTKGARCTFSDYKCEEPCYVPGGPQLTRKI